MPQHWWVQWCRCMCRGIPGLPCPWRGPSCHNCFSKKKTPICLRVGGVFTFSFPQTHPDARRVSQSGPSWSGCFCREEAPTPERGVHPCRRFVVVSLWHPWHTKADWKKKKTKKKPLKHQNKLMKRKTFSSAHQTWKVTDKANALISAFPTLATPSASPSVPDGT